MQGWILSFPENYVQAKGESQKLQVLPEKIEEEKR